jgi:hypothetical protein
MMRLASTAVASAAWGVAGVAAALLLVQLLAPLGATALFLALSATAAYAGLTEIGARRGLDPVLGSLAEAAATGVVHFWGSGPFWGSAAPGCRGQMPSWPGRRSGPISLSPWPGLSP